MGHRGKGPGRPRRRTAVGRHGNADPAAGVRELQPRRDRRLPRHQGRRLRRLPGAHGPGSGHRCGERTGHRTGRGGPVPTAISAHLCAGLPHLARLEYAWGEVPRRHELLAVHERFEDGKLVVPEGPGFGIRLDDAVVGAHT
ncbi:enolase C-terminal domain-like protein [Streptomyces sp. NBC_01012]|uniref:enolase C-terminal domain-like protein n=1 Tax=Streptomyces sp. NBC_01012 TaxID=2903717 RepID=UPI0038698190